ncbi:MAG: hypothetical protein KAS71_09195, partial [Bacteroidales bacterium]|nr:hypothetical protein [Bacteroidales bacterium]
LGHSFLKKSKKSGQKQDGEALDLSNLLVLDYQLMERQQHKLYEQPKIAKELVCLPTLFLPTLKTNFFGGSSASIELNLDCNKLIFN